MSECCCAAAAADGGGESGGLAAGPARDRVVEQCEIIAFENFGNIFGKKMTCRNTLFVTMIFR